MEGQDHVFTPLNELEVRHSGRSKIRVKVFVKWAQTYGCNPKKIASHEMILIDHLGNKIVAGVKNELYENYFINTLVEGNYLIIQNFGVEAYNVSCKLVEHRFKVQCGMLTTATLIECFNIASFGFKPVNYDDLITCNFPQTKPIDVVGQLHSVQSKKEHIDEDVVKKSISFCMRDVSGKDVNCTVWGEHADQLAEFVATHLNEETPRVIMIHNGQLKCFMGEHQVSNLMYGCRIFMEDNVEPIAEFISVLNQRGEEGEIASLKIPMMNGGPQANEINE